VTRGTEWVAAAQPAKREPASAHHTMTRNRFGRVIGTAGKKPAGAPKIRPENQLI